MNLLGLPVTRPVATAMFFIAIVLLGSIAVQRMPVELFPKMEGDELFVNFYRSGSTPDYLEREILIPLESRIAAMPDVKETTAEIRGSSGNMQILFELGTDIKIREYELGRIAADLQRLQDRGTTSIQVRRNDTSGFSDFVMTVQLVADDRDKNMLFDIAEHLVAPRLASVNGISQATASGGGGRQVNIVVDPSRTAGLGVTTENVTDAIRRNMGRSEYVGSLEDENGRTDVIFDGAIRSLSTLENARVSNQTPLRISHLGDVDFGFAIEDSLFRVNGQAAVGIHLFKEQGANLLSLGSELVERVAQLRQELRSLGVDLIITQNGAESIQEQVDRLSTLGLSGFAIAMLVLFLFLRQWRAVAVVGIAVPVSVVTALAALYLLGFTINLISLFGLALSVGLLVDNSIVVYEAILRSIERGVDPFKAAQAGVRRTVRAIAAACLTTAVVFLPIAIVDLDSAFISQLMTVVAVSMLLPIGASLLVAVGLVPLLAHRLAAPAALKRAEAKRERREQKGGLVAPDRSRILFGGFVSSALREPPAWVTGTVFVLIASLLFGIPAVMTISNDAEAQNADQVEFAARFNRGGVRNLEAGSQMVARLEVDLLNVPGVDRVETVVREEGANLTVHFVDLEDRPPDLTVGKIRGVAEKAGKRTWGLEIMRPGEESFASRGGGGSRGGGRQEYSSRFSGAAREVIISGPDSGKLYSLGDDIEERLESMSYIGNAWVSSSRGMEEIWVQPRRSALEAFGLTLTDVLPVLNLAGTEGVQMPNGYTLTSGREIPVNVERVDARDPTTARRELSKLRLRTAAGVLPISTLAETRRMPAPTVIVHKDGRREMSVRYRLSSSAPRSGSAREALIEEVEELIRGMPRPAGYTIEIPADNETASIAEKLILPILLLVFLVLAMTFESLTLPVLVLLAWPLTVIGATWSMVLAQTPLGPMAIAGIVALAGLTVNPAILLIDRMQQKTRVGWSPGAAALGAVKERTRPVLMTAATTIAALSPLALTTGRENEIWPPFAVIVIGGLVTSTILNLVIMPVGYIMLNKLDRLFGRAGPWLVVGWLGSTIAIMTAFIMTDVIESLGWQIVVTLLVGSLLLAAVILTFRRSEYPEPVYTDGTPELVVSYLRKIYGLPGTIRRALNAQREFVSAVIKTGGQVFSRAETAERVIVFGLLAAGAAALGWLAERGAVILLFWFVATAFTTRILYELRKHFGGVDEHGELDAGRIVSTIAFLLPWTMLAGYAYVKHYIPYTENEAALTNLFWPIAGAILLMIGQLVRLSAVRQARGKVEERVTAGMLKIPRTILRKIARTIGGLDLPKEQVHALTSVSFSVKKGMIGILGPNGAGKTTLLRQLAGIIEPTRGSIHIGGVPLKKIQNVLARWVGYLPQDAGLPQGHSPREYLKYYAALYNIEPAEQNKRVENLLAEVGLSDKMDDKIGQLSGGMRQRVAVARTLLRLPSIIIVDEPTVGLDPRERIRFRNLLARLAETRIVLFSTHVVEDVAISCERVLVMANSRLRFDGSPTELAKAATGKVWQRLVEPGEDKAIPDDAILAEESPNAEGQTVQRIVAEAAPTSESQQLESRPEDGYLWLLASAEAAPA